VQTRARAIAVDKQANDTAMQTNAPPNLPRISCAITVITFSCGILFSRSAYEYPRYSKLS